jgi:putative aldouronate transport system permease protein
MSKHMDTTGYKIFSVCNYFFLALVAFLCTLPLINVLAVSFSAPSRASAGEVILWPLGFTLDAYARIIGDAKFLGSFRISVFRVILGALIGVGLTIICAYPLSKDSSVFKGRKYFVWYFFFTMLFGGGLIPTYLVVYYTNLMDKIWALVIPGAVSTWNIILMLNFFRQLPKELEEAAMMDGANHWTVLWKVVVPISKPVIATVTLFIMVGHWNSWFDGMLYMRKARNYPLQTYLQSLLTVDISRFVTVTQKAAIDKVNTKTLTAAQIFVTAFPILLVYPFLQKHFTQGLVLGSVKG